jgi:hypothetical protein
MENDATEQVREALKQWVSLDDQSRELQARQRELRQQKQALSETILGFMRDNHVDNFALEGNSTGSISRSVRTSRPPLRREQIRTQLLIQFADQPQRVAEVLRAIEGVSEGDDMMSAGGTVRELLTRRVPKQKVTMNASL